VRLVHACTCMRRHALRQLPAEGRVNTSFLQEQLLEGVRPASHADLHTQATLQDPMWLSRPRRALQEMVAQFAEERGAAEAAHAAAMRDASAVAAAAQACPPRRRTGQAGAVSIFVCRRLCREGAMQRSVPSNEAVRNVMIRGAECARYARACAVCLTRELSMPLAASAPSLMA